MSRLSKGREGIFLHLRLPLVSMRVFSKDSISHLAAWPVRGMALETPFPAPLPFFLFRGAAFAVAFFWALLQAPLFAQMVFPDLLPPESTVIASLPDTEAAWTTFQATPFFQAWRELPPSLAPWRAAGNASGAKSGPMALPLQENGLFGKALSAAEFAIVPAGKGDDLSFLCLGRIGDRSALRNILEAFEKKIASQAASPGNPVTRQEESIGQTVLVIFTDASSSIGYFLNGPRRICAFSNGPELLRETARRLESKEQGPAPFPEMRQAWTALLRGPSAKDPDGYSLRFFLTPPLHEDQAGRDAAGMDLLLENLQPRGGAAGGLKFGPDGLRIETFALFPSRGESLSAELYRSASPTRELPGARAAAPDAMLVSGNNLFDVPALKRYLVRAIDRWSAALPEPASTINPASARAQAHLAMLRGWFSDPDFLAELGPGAFFALNDISFTAPGEFPKMDFLAGIQTRDSAATRSRMMALEKDLLDAVTAAWRQTADSLTPHSTSPAPADAPAKESPHFADSEKRFPDGNPVARFLVVPGLPDSIRPAWSVAHGQLLVALSPETLERTESRLAKPEGAERLDQFEEDRARCGMDRVHAYQVVRADRAGRTIRAIAEALAARRDPSLQPHVARAAAVLEPIQTLLIFRRGEESGVRTVGEIRTPSFSPLTPVQ